MNGRAFILLVDDERDLHELLQIHLEKAGFQFRAFANASSFLRFLEKSKPDLILLDLMLPDGDGMEICRFLKRREKYASIPVIMLTAKTEEIDRVLGLEMGADDYITKPFSPRELVARVKAVLRRMTPSEETIRIQTGIILMDVEKHEVLVEGKEIPLSPTEFNLLKILLSKKGWVFSREKLLDFLWGMDKVVTDRTIDVHIKNLRSKLGKAARHIKNVRGVGYKFEE